MDRGRHVVAAESVSGGRLVGTHAFFGDSPDEAERRYRAYLLRKGAQALGQPPASTPSLVWQSIAPSGDSYQVQQGARYAALASVSKNYALSDVVSYLGSHGWIVTYSWEQGQASRGLYPVDDWLSSLAPDTTDNHRWLYAEANRSGADASLGVKAPWPFTFYSIANVFQAVPAPAVAPSAAPVAPVLPPPASVSASSPAPAPVAVYVVSAFALGSLVTAGLWWGRKFLF